MKKIIILLVCLFSLDVVFASTNTFDRTEDDLRVHSSINVTNSNKQYILNTPSVDENEKIYDFSNLLSDSEEVTLFNKITEFIKKFNMDMVILTTNDNPRSTAKKYAEDFYDYNYFGIGNNFDGILFLIDMENREISVNTTGNAIIMYDDERIDNILDETYNYISIGDYYNTCLSFIEESYDYALEGTPDSNKNVYIDEFGDLKEKEEIPFLWCFLISFAITVIIMLILINLNKMVKKKINVQNNLSNETLKIEDLGKKLINTHTSSTRIVSSSSTGGYSSSGRVGGSSTSRGSSGRSHGGGSRRF